ncbi:MAG: hypothetical protein RL134_619 [Actinomycetota bacterium]|jgi:hypothetical protein
MFSAKVRKAIYALSAPIIAVLIVVGVEADAAAAWVAAGLAVANLVLAFLNVPGDEE